MTVAKTPDGTRRAPGGEDVRPPTVTAVSSADLAHYRTIVVDPPWPYPEGWPVGNENGQVSRHACRRGVPFDPRRRTPLPYPSLSVPKITALPISQLAHPAGCHLYLWTTNRYLNDAFALLRAWRFRYGQTLVWCKKPMGIGPGGVWAQNVEYILVARCGRLPRSPRRFESCWFDWPRMGKAHSRKPEAFFRMVEETSFAPYLELFARRRRPGWHSWGNEVRSDLALEVG